MGPNKKKSYLRKLEKSGYSLKKIIEIIDLFGAEASRVKSSGNNLKEFDNSAFNELQQFLTVCSEMGLNMSNILEFDTRPFLVGFITARLKYNKFKSMSFEDVQKEAENVFEYKFEELENILVEFPEYGYRTYASVFEKNQVNGLNIPKDYKYVSMNQLISNLNFLQSQFNFNYVIVHIKNGEVCQKFIHNYTLKNKQGNCKVHMI